MFWTLHLHDSWMALASAVLVKLTFQILYLVVAALLAYPVPPFQSHMAKLFDHLSKHQT
jgi:hypothetical protein